MSLSTPTLRTKKGNCECCTEPHGLNTTLYFMHGNMWQCKVCRDKDTALAANPVVVATVKTDENIVSESDILTANTIPLIEIRAAINADASIPEANKGYAFLECLELHYATLKAAMTVHRKALNDIEVALREVQKNGQEEYPKLRMEHQERFAKMFNVSLAPVVKPAKPKKEGKPIFPSTGATATKDGKPRTPRPASSGAAPRFNMVELKELAEKYGLDTLSIRNLSVRKGCSMEAAAKMLADLRDS